MGLLTSPRPCTQQTVLTMRRALVGALYEYWLWIFEWCIFMSKLWNSTADPQDQDSYLPSPVQTPRLPTTITSLCPLLIILNFLQKSQEPYLNFVQHIKFYNYFWKLIHYYFKLWTYVENSLKAVYCSTALINCKKMLTFLHLGD